MCSPQTTKTGTKKNYFLNRKHIIICMAPIVFIVIEFLYVERQCYKNNNQLGLKRKLVLRHFKQIMTFFLSGPVFF